MESGTFAGDPRVATPTTKTMLRALAVSFAMFVAVPGLCAQTTPAVVDVQNSDVSSNQPNPHSNSAAGTSSGEDSTAENELFEAANKSREQSGVSPLRTDESLRQAARAHVQLMVATELLEHRLSGESALLERIAQVSSLKIDRAGENIANAASASSANDTLMRSAPHQKNLLDRGFNVVGIAAIWSKGRLYVVQDFAHEVESYSAQQTRKLVGRAVAEMRQQAGLPELVQLTTPSLDEAACTLATENRPNAHLLAAAYDNRKTITYTQSHPEVLPQGALRLLRDPGVHRFAVGSCYARDAKYPNGIYWVAILLY